MFVIWVRKSMWLWARETDRVEMSRWNYGGKVVASECETYVENQIHFWVKHRKRKQTHTFHLSGFEFSSFFSINAYRTNNSIKWCSIFCCCCCYSCNQPNWQVRKSNPQIYLAVCCCPPQWNIKCAEQSKRLKCSCSESEHATKNVRCAKHRQGGRTHFPTEQRPNEKRCKRSMWCGRMETIKITAIHSLDE